MNFVFNANGRLSANVEHTCIDATVSCGWAFTNLLYVFL